MGGKGKERRKRSEEGMDGEEGREMGGETTNKGMEKKVKFKGEE